MTDRERETVRSIARLLATLESHGNELVDGCSRGIEPSEWETRYGAVLKTSIKHLLLLTHHH